MDDNLNKADFISILGIHRETIISHEVKSGINQWALLASIGSIIWLVISLYEVGNLNYSDAILLLIATTWFLPLLNLVNNTLLVSKTKSSYYNYLSEELNSNILNMLFRVLTYIVSIWALNTHFALNSYSFWVINMYAGFSILLILFLLVISKHVPPISNSAPKSSIMGKTQYWGTIIAFVINVAAVISILVLVKDFYSITTLKSALLFVGLYWLILELLKSYNRNPMLDSIDKLIGQVTFDEIEMELAQNKLRLILLGEKFTDIIAPSVQDFIDKNLLFQSLIKKTINRINQYDKGSDDLKDALKDAVFKNRNDLEQMQEEMVVITDKINTQLAFYNVFEQGSRDFNEVQTTLFEQNKATQEKLDELIEIWDKFYTKLEE